MRTQAFQRLFKRSVGFAIATASLVATTPVLAESCPQKAANTGLLALETTAQAAVTGTIVDIAASNKSFSTLVTAVKAAGLVEVLSGKSPLTVFAPTNEAFAALPAGTVEKLLKPENRAQLTKILTYHVVPGSVTSNMLKSGEVKTVEGSSIKVKVKNKKVMINNAKVTTADIKASNGVIHVIDKVILPPDLK